MGIVSQTFSHGKIQTMPSAAPRIRAPEFAPGEWLNTPRPLRLADLRGRPLLVDVWDFTCLNCLRTLPYLAAWYRAYTHLGAAFVGIHTPEFEFAKDRRQVEAAVRRLRIEYPVLLDNEYKNWDAFANRYWPTLYLIDREGYLRHAHHGEGGYTETEQVLRALVAEAAPAAALPRTLGLLRDEDHPGAVCFRTTPELHAGYHQGALGNPEGYPPHGVPLIYGLPPQREEGYFYVEGVWRAGDDFLALAGQRGALVLPYHAATANAVLAHSADPVDLRLDLKPPVTLTVTQDGRPLETLSAGEDIYFQDGQSLLRVDAPRLYQIARNPDARPHEVRLETQTPGLTVFAFSFSTCAIRGHPFEDRPKR
jgi:thiol-disulfide isomerase/thioredoxin